MDLGVQGQKPELIAGIPSYRNSFLHVGRNPQPVLLAGCRRSVEFDHPHPHVYVLFDQNPLTNDPDQAGEIPHLGTNWAILYRNFLQCCRLVHGRKVWYAKQPVWISVFAGVWIWSHCSLHGVFEKEIQEKGLRIVWFLFVSRNQFLSREFK